MELQERIASFKNMVEADPENELGHFSLGKAYLDAGRAEEAAGCFSRVLELNQGFSKAYQHLAEAQRKLGQEDQAIDTLTAGYSIAAERGDVMPREAMGKMLQELGRPVPEVAGAAPEAPVAFDGPAVDCCRCGRRGPRLSERPFKGPTGESILENVCQLCWNEWLAMGTKVINELRLDFSNPAAGEVYDSHMKEFLQLPE